MLAEGEDIPEQQQGFIKNRKRGKKPTPGSVKVSVKKTDAAKVNTVQEEVEDEDMNDGDFSNEESDSEGVVV